MREYAQLGTVATRLQVQNDLTAIEALRKDYEAYRRTSETKFRQQFRERLEEATLQRIAVILASCLALLTYHLIVGTFSLLFGTRVHLLMHSWPNPVQYQRNTL